MGKALSAAGVVVDIPVISDLARSAAATRANSVKARHTSQQQARAEQASLEQQAVQYFIRGEAFPTELKDYHAALGEVLTASVGDVVALPARPVLAAKPV